MAYAQLAYAHLLTVVPAFVLGTYLMVRSKGTPHHKVLGRAYLALMLITVTITLFMPAAIGSRIFGHFGYIHLLSFFTLWVVPTAYLAARSHNLKRHRNSMIGLYFGGLLIAGSFAFMPGRMLHGWLFAS